MLQLGNGTLASNELTPSIVYYGTSSSSLDQTANGTAETYDQIYPSNVSVLNVTNALNYRYVCHPTLPAALHYNHIDAGSPHPKMLVC